MLYVSGVAKSQSSLCLSSMYTSKWLGTGENPSYEPIFTVYFMIMHLVISPQTT